MKGLTGLTLLTAPILCTPQSIASPNNNLNLNGQFDVLSVCITCKIVFFVRLYQVTKLTIIDIYFFTFYALDFVANGNVSLPKLYWLNLIES